MIVMLWQRVERLLLTIWVGALWSIGFLAVPALFSILSDRALAGSIAGVLFELVGYVGLVCGILLWFGNWFLKDARSLSSRWRKVILLMLMLVALGQFVLHPMVSELRAAGLVQGSEAAAHFAKLHGLASLVYLVVSLLGLGLVWFYQPFPGTRNTSSLP